MLEGGSSKKGAVMAHGDQEDKLGNNGKISKSSERSEAAMNSGETKQALRHAEDLSLPSVQVVVMSANMGCSHCRQRVTKVVSKMNGLVDYMVDFGKKEVTVRGMVPTKKKRKQITYQRKRKRFYHTAGLSWLLGCYSF